MILLDPFGFEKDGFYNISINSDEVFDLILIMDKTLDTIDYSSIKQYCIQHEKSSLNFLNFQGNVTRKGVYYPILIDCDVDIQNGTKKKYWIDIFYRNPKNYIDYRSVLLPNIYLALTIIYFLIFFIWTGNGIIFPKFKIQLHTLLTIQPLIKVISLYSCYLFWENMKKGDDKNQGLITISTMFGILLYAMFLTTIGLVGFGWCIFGTLSFRVRPKQFLEIVISSLILVGGFAVVPYLKNVLWCIIIIPLIIISFLYYFKINFINIFMVSQLFKKLISQPIICSKIKLAKNFVEMSFSLLCFCIITCMLIVMMGCHDGFLSLFFEICYLVLNLMMMKSFLYRKSYSGIEKETLESSEIKKLQVHACYLIEPKNREMVLIQNV